MTPNFKIYWGVPGVYAIKHVPSGRVYVGQTQNIGARWTVHLSTLRGGTHHCRYLQNVWNKYPEEEFKFLGLQIVRDLSKLDGAETRWFNRFSGLLLNTHPPGKSHRGFKHSTETRLKISSKAKKMANSIRGREQRRKQAIECHRKGLIKYREIVRPVRVCIKCGVQFNRYKLFSGGLHGGETCLECMARTYVNQGGRFH